MGTRRFVMGGRRGGRRRPARLTAVAASLALAALAAVAVAAGPASAEPITLPMAMTGDGTHLIAVQNTGRVVNYWIDTGLWQGPGGTGGTARSDSPVAVDAAHANVVFIDASGNVVDDTFSTSTGWVGPTAIGGKARAGSPIAISADGTHVVFVDSSGRVTNDWFADGAWQGPSALPGTVRADSPITINDDATMVAYIDNTSHVAVDTQLPGIWQGTTVLGGTPRAESALAASNNGQVVAFFDTSGRVVDDWLSNGAWAGPAVMGGTGRADSPLVLNGAPNRAFFVDTSGRVVNDWIAASGAWAGPSGVGGTAAADSTMATVDGINMVVFVDPTGNLAIDWSSGGWHGPGALKTITTGFRGLNWADPGDNFSSGVRHVSGLSASDTYDSAAAVADQVVSQLYAKTGANTLRMPVNEPTVAQFWSTYTGAIDTALSKGNVILAYWTPAYTYGAPPDMAKFYAMWDKVVAKYTSSPHALFEVINEPHGQSNTTLANMYDDWLTRYPGVPRQRVILDGNNTATDPSVVGADSRLNGTRIAIHDYTWFDQPDVESEAGWSAQLAEMVTPYANRTLMTEWGAPMTSGLDYLTSTPGNKNIDYVRGVSTELRSTGVGGVYWPGFRDGDGFSMLGNTSTAPTITLTVNNPSGLSLLRHAWGF
jgi:hypothetical protein